MKFKRDYYLEIRADVNDRCFWKGTHKGEILRDVEDYETVLSMLDEVREYVKGAIKLKERLGG